MGFLALVFLAATAAGAVSALGVLPLVRRKAVPVVWLGWANALAAGVMLGAAYLLAAASMDGPALPVAGGALLGIVAIHGSHRLSGAASLPLNLLSAQEPGYGPRIVAIHTLHAVAEGVALGAAMTVDVAFGLVLAAGIALHNVPEATILTAVLRGGGVPLEHGAILAVGSNLSQVVFAVGAFLALWSFPVLLPWLLGLALGALVHLVLVELLPESYREAGHTAIALLVLVSVGVVALLGGVLG